MYQKLQKGMEVNDGEVDALVRMLSATISRGDDFIESPPVKPEEKTEAKSASKPKAKSETISQGSEKVPNEKIIVDKVPFDPLPPASETKPVKNGNGSASNHIQTQESYAKSATQDRPSTGPKRKFEVNEDVVIRTLKKSIAPYSHRQGEYIQCLNKSDVVFAAGPAGTGKTYIAVAAAVRAFVEGKVDRIILCRPAVEAGEKLGFLPGDMKEKIDPYLRPLYDALYDMMPAEKVIRHMESGEIEIAALAFMRGRTLRYSYVILDEAQNTTPSQMKMFLTRLGEGSHMAITGDLSQTDLPRDIKSGFRDAIEKLKDIDEISIINFGDEDIVRHPLTMKIVQAYEKLDKKIWD
ncbi:MAG: PhoH family protein [Proteobacteria bacterium]|nr:PhoH family protein [Pseudomonadota bacterium]